VGPQFPTVGLRKGLEVEMSENLAEQVIRPSYEQIVGSIRHSGVQELLRRAQEDERRRAWKEARS
jgi:hypothetical protein